MTRINGQPTSFWVTRGRFRVSPGTNIVRAAYSDRRVTFGYQKIEFVAVRDAVYRIAREYDPKVPSPISASPHPANPRGWIVLDRRDRVIVRERTETEFSPIVADAPREDFIFGRSTAEAAIEDYRQRNPDLARSVPRGQRR